MARSLVCALVCLAVACSSEVADESDDSIVGGSQDHGHPAVVAIRIGGTALCSGSLVAPNVVLTARHCVSDTTESVDCSRSGAQIHGDRDPKTMLVYAGDSASGPAIARGRALVVPASNRLCGADAAAIVLDRNVGGITPLGIAAPRTGEKGTAVGYGRQGAWGPVGTKMKRSIHVLAVGAKEIDVSEASCPGDSGGPVLDASGAIVGIVSRGLAPCDGSTSNIYSRADVHRDLLQRAVLR